MIDHKHIIDSVCFNEAGLIPVITQQYDSNEVLMLAWMNEAALIETLKSGMVTYYSRSRKKLWCKGETSGQFQKLISLLVDCDGDTILLKVDQKGVACHTGHQSCFFMAANDGKLVEISDVIVPPDKLYGA